MKILMVCLGNICRSPMAEGILRELSSKRGIDITTDSCGTGGWHVDESPDKRAQKKMTEKNMDIADLRARKFSVDDFEKFDILFVMDDSNYNNIIALAENEEHKNKVRMILNETFPDENMSVPDPYFGGEEGFESVYNLLFDACTNFLTTNYGDN